MTALDSTTVWLAVAGLSLVTFWLRSSFLLGIARVDELPAALERVLPFVPPAVLAALIGPNLFLVGGAVDVGPGNPRLAAGLVAAGVAWYTESMLATVGAGMVVLWTLLWL